MGGFGFLAATVARALTGAAKRAAGGITSTSLISRAAAERPLYVLLRGGWVGKGFPFLPLSPLPTTTIQPLSLPLIELLRLFRTRNTTIEEDDPTIPTTTTIIRFERR